MEKMRQNNAVCLIFVVYSALPKHNPRAWVLRNRRGEKVTASVTSLFHQAALIVPQVRKTKKTNQLLLKKNSAAQPEASPQNAVTPRGQDEHQVEREGHAASAIFAAPASTACSSLSSARCE